MAKTPVFLLDGLSFTSQHADLRNKIERVERGILPTCTVEDTGGFLYLRKLGDGGTAGTAGTVGAVAAGEIAWIRRGAHEETIRLLDRAEEPWRKRAIVLALPDGDSEAVPCWAYFPEAETKRRTPRRKTDSPAPRDQGTGSPA